jgi:uncharacterized SAM-binding protein YcdF (DUF218 family)
MGKLLLLLEPLGMVWLTLLAASLWLYRRHLKREFFFICGLWCFYSLFTCTTLGHHLIRSLESPWVRWEWDSLPTTDALLCLGGAANSAAGEITGIDLVNSSDRISTAVELIRRGKASNLIISGGVTKKKKATSETQATVKWIKCWNLVTSPIHPLNECSDTHDEALRMQELMQQQGWRTLTLVTSASHMRRAQATFAKCGIQVIPVACAYLSDADDREPITEYIHLPQYGELHNINCWLHERIGYLYYHLRGWI